MHMRYEVDVVEKRAFGMNWMMGKAVHDVLLFMVRCELCHIIIINYPVKNSCVYLYEAVGLYL